jgi:hypothetical protein
MDDRPTLDLIRTYLQSRADTDALISKYYRNKSMWDIAYDHETSENICRQLLYYIDHPNLFDSALDGLRQTIQRFEEKMA